MGIEAGISSCPVGDADGKRPCAVPGARLFLAILVKLKQI